MCSSNVVSKLPVLANRKVNCLLKPFLLIQGSTRGLEIYRGVKKKDVLILFLFSVFLHHPSFQYLLRN